MIQALVCPPVSASGETPTVVIVEDHVALRRGLALIDRRRPDVAIIDINLPGQSGIELTRSVLAQNPELGVLLYTGVDDQDTLSAALDCGARGFALKAGAPEELLA